MQQRLLVGVAQHRNEQSRVGIDRDADVVVVLDNQGLGDLLQTGVELRILLQGVDQRLDEEGGGRELGARLFVVGLELGPQSLDAAHVRISELGDMGQGNLVLDHPGRNDLSQRGQRLAGDGTKDSEVLVDEGEAKSLGGFGVLAGAGHFGLEFADVAGQIFDDHAATGGGTTDSA